MLIVVDTETTDLRPGQICQLSYVVDDGLSPRGVNYFFAVDSMGVGAQRVHGFSMEYLQEASGGKHFGDYAEEIHEALMGSTTLAAHNINFDYGFLQEEFNRVDRPLNIRTRLCTMYHFTKLLGLPGRGGKAKPPSLKELMGYFQVTPQMAMHEAQRLFGFSGSAHDARYDSAATWLCLHAAMQQGAIRNLLPENPGQITMDLF